MMIFILVTFMAVNISGKNNNAGNMETVTFGEGCFWCTEAIFKNLKGVEEVTSGYSGGSMKAPLYDDVCSGKTGHAEVVQILFAPSVISFRELLEVFWSTHDPTTRDRQGADVGTQYRSVIFYHSEEQKEIAEQYKKELNDANVFGKPVVTEISVFKKFYKAEDYHQDYYQNNPDKSYCQFVIIPKLKKFKEIFGDKLK
jgi:peptide-methionine (S)-S-oxide reductase